MEKTIKKADLTKKETMLTAIENQSKKLVIYITESKMVIRSLVNEKGNVCFNLDDIAANLAKYKEDDTSATENSDTDSHAKA